MIWGTSERGFQPVEDVDSPVQWLCLANIASGQKALTLAW
jgi:hypothetical protein